MKYFSEVDVSRSSRLVRYTGYVCLLVLAMVAQSAYAAADLTVTTSGATMHSSFYSYKQFLFDGALTNLSATDVAVGNTWMYIQIDLHSDGSIDTSTYYSYFGNIGTSTTRSISTWQPVSVSGNHRYRFIFSTTVTESNTSNNWTSWTSFTVPEFVDLVSGGMSATPTTTQPGNTVTLTSRVTNFGTATSSGSFTFNSVYLDHNYDGVAEYTLPVGISVPPLGPGASTTISVPWNIPADAPYGPYRMSYFVDETNEVAEYSEANNFSYWSTPFSLVRTQCDGTLIPQGSTPITMWNMAGGCDLATTTYNSTAGSCSSGYTGSCTYRCTGTAGGYTSSGIIASDWTASGSDFSCQLSTTTAYADLTVNSFINGQPLIGVMYYPGAGNTVAVPQGTTTILTAGPIYNQGNATSTAFEISSISLDAPTFSSTADYTVAVTSTVPAIPPGGSAYVSVPWTVPADAPLGRYRGSFLIDSTGLVPELNKVNNFSTWASGNAGPMVVRSECPATVDVWQSYGYSSWYPHCDTSTTTYYGTSGTCSVGYTGVCNYARCEGDGSANGGWYVNNTMTAGSCTPLPSDIVPGTPSVNYTTTDGDSTFAPRGEVVTLRSGTIQNTGTGNAWPFEVEFYLDFNNDGVAEYTVPVTGDVATITPGGTTEVTASWTVPLDAPQGAYRISYIVDPEGLVSETYAGDSETNNFSGWHDGPFVVEGSCNSEVVSGDFTGGCVVEDALFYETRGSCNTGYTGTCTYQCMGWNGTTYESVLKNSNWEIKATPGDECRAMSIDVFRVCSSDLTHCAETGETLTVDVSTPLTITWNSTETDLCTAVSGSGFNTATLTDGSDTVGNTAPALPEQIDTYSIACNDNGNTPLQASVVVETSINLPVLTASATVLPTGSTTRLTWDTNTGDEGLCTLTGAGVSTSDLTNGTGDAQTGYVDVVIEGRTTYTLECPSGVALKTFEIIPATWE